MTVDYLCCLERAPARAAGIAPATATLVATFAAAAHVHAGPAAAEATSGIGLAATGWCRRTATLAAGAATATAGTAARAPAALATAGTAATAVATLAGAGARRPTSRALRPDDALVAVQHHGLDAARYEGMRYLHVNLAADEFLDILEVSALFVFNERKRGAERAGPAGAANPVHVGFGLVGDFVVDDVG